MLKPYSTAILMFLNASLTSPADDEVLLLPGAAPVCQDCKVPHVSNKKANNLAGVI
jgi:hypothetical protein